MGVPSAVVFLDSGIGGLPYLDWVRARRRTERFVYVADRLSFPYGSRGREELQELVTRTVGRIVTRIDPKLIVVACNTASVGVIGELRRRFEVPFVGVVPAVKPAAQCSRIRRIGLLATPGTVADVYTNRLIDEFAADCSVVRVGDAAIVEFVERRALIADKEERRRAVTESIAEFGHNRIDALVVGCTHFLHILPELQEALGPDVMVIDSRDGVGRQVERLLGQPPAAAVPVAAADLYVTDERLPDDPYERYARRYGLVFRGTL